MAMKYEGALCIKIGDEIIPVCPAKIDDYDGGVFTIHETDRKSSKRNVTWHRVGTVDKAKLEAVTE